MKQNIKTKRCNNLESIRMKFEHYQVCKKIIIIQKDKITELENRMDRLSSPSLIGIKCSNSTTLIDLISRRDDELKKLSSMSEYWLIKEVDGYLELLENEERKLLEDKFFAGMSYEDLSFKLNYTAPLVWKKVNSILKKIAIMNA